MHNGSSCAQRYEQLVSERETFLDRARECARLTIPTLMPESGHSQSSRFYTPYQGIGARGVNNLAAKLLLSLLPPNSPFFRLTIDDFTLEELTKQEGMRAKVEEGLNKVERAVMSEIESSGLRPPVFEALKQLIVSGNVLFVTPKDGGARVFRMDRYVVKRCTMGNALEVIIKEETAFAALPDDLKEIATAQTGLPSDLKKEINVYTKYYREGNKWIGYQEIDGVIVPGSEGKWPIEKPPFMALRWTRIDGEDYGRSYVEEYLGDLVALEGLSKAIVEASAASAKVLFMVTPNGVTREKDIAEAPNGAIVTGEASEVSTLQVQKQADMSVASSVSQEITSRLAFAFLMNTSIQRQAERVTAEEVRYMAGELEDALGGVYSLLSQEFQLPLVNRIMDRMTAKRRLPKLPKGVVAPTIVTGLEALGRGHDLNKYQALMQSISVLGPEVISEYLNPSDFIKRVGTALGIDMDGLVKSQEQLQAEQQAAMQTMQEQQMMDMAQSAVAPAINAAAKGAN